MLNFLWFFLLPWLPFLAPQPTDDGPRLAEHHESQSHPGLELPTSVDIFTSLGPTLLLPLR